MVLHLPIVTVPEADESFQSWIRRYARSLRVSALELYQAFDLTEEEVRFVAHSHGFGLPDALVNKITEATGLSRQVLRRTSFDRYAHLPSLDFNEVRQLRRLRGVGKGWSFEILCSLSSRVAGNLPP